MHKSKRLILYGFYVIACLTTEVFILWLFPYTGLGGLICYPTTIIFSLGLGFVIYKVAKRQLKIWQLSILVFLVFIFQTTLQLWTTPQDVGGTTFSKIGNAFQAYKNYNKIEFEDFSNLTTADRIIYIYKFKNKLPNSFITLQIDSLKNEYESTNPRTYLIQNIGGKRQFDKSKINIEENDTATIITEYYHQTDTLIYNMHKNFMNTRAGGYNNRIISLGIYEDDFKIKTGIEKLLYEILKLTKKPNR